MFVISDMKRALIPDSLVTSHPILVPVNHPDEINEIFDSISYNKVGRLKHAEWEGIEVAHFDGREDNRKKEKKEGGKEERKEGRKKERKEEW